MEGGRAHVNNLGAQWAEDEEFEDERGQAGECEDDDVELNEAKKRAGHGGMSAEGPADGEGEIDEECAGIKPQAVHGPEGQGNGQGAECEQAVDAPPGA